MTPLARISLLFAILGLSTSSIVTGCGGANQADTGEPQTPTSTPSSVTSISPTAVLAGAPALPLTVLGTGFQPSSVVQVNGASVPTQYVSATQLTAGVPAASLSSGASLSITVLTGTTSTGSAGSPITLEVDNPAPIISGLAPNGFVAGTSPGALSVAGSGFITGTVIQVNGSSRTTTYLSGTQVSVALTAADIASAGNLALTAVNPPPGGGTSAAATLPILNPAPGTIVVFPNAFVTGGATVSVDVQGTNFVAGSIARVNGSPRATSVAYPTVLSFQLTAADQASPGQLTVEVFNPAPGGGTSAPVRITITSATPILSIVNPAQLTVGSSDSQIQIRGAGLAWGETVQWNGADLKTGFTYSDPP